MLNPPPPIATICRSTRLDLRLAFMSSEKDTASSALNSTPLAVSVQCAFPNRSAVRHALWLILAFAAAILAATSCAPRATNPIAHSLAAPAPSIQAPSNPKPPREILVESISALFARSQSTEAARLASIRSISDLSAQMARVAIPALCYATADPSHDVRDAAHAVLQDVLVKLEIIGGGPNDPVQQAQAFAEWMNNSSSAPGLDFFGAPEGLIKATALRWSIAFGGWKDAPQLADLMGSSDPLVRRLALLIAFNWLNDPKGTQTPRPRRRELDEDARVRIAHGLALEAETKPLIAYSLADKLRVLAWDRPELSKVYFDSFNVFSFYRGVWSAIDELQQASPSGRYMARAIPLMITAYENPSPDDRRSQVAAIVRRLTPENRASAFRFIRQSIKIGSYGSLELLAEFPDEAPALLMNLMQDKDADIRLRAGRVLLAIDRHNKPEVAASWRKLLNDPDERVRTFAAQAIGTKDALVEARLVTLLQDLRSTDPHIRFRAATELSDMTAVDRQITAALLRAVNERDMPAREGLLLAIERAGASQKSPAEELTIAAANDPDPVRRAYAKAALRALQSQR
jgi:HEAT repeat protein